MQPAYLPVRRSAGAADGAVLGARVLQRVQAVERVVVEHQVKACCAPAADGREGLLGAHGRAERREVQVDESIGAELEDGEGGAGAHEVALSGHNAVKMAATTLAIMCMCMCIHENSLALHFAYVCLTDCS